MGLFKKKKTEQQLYWENNKEEQKQIEESGNVKLSVYNQKTSQMDVSTSIDEIISLKEVCIPILDWFAILDKRDCPYHLIGGAEKVRNIFFTRYNSAIVSANKHSSNDFISARDYLCKEAENYDLCLSELSRQSGNDHFYGTPQRWIKTVSHFYNENRAIDLLNIYVECGMPYNIAFSKNSDIIDSYMPFQKGTNESDIYNTYSLAVSNRHYLAYMPLKEVSKTIHELNITNDETVHHCIWGTTLYEEITIRRDITYSGIRWSNGLLRAGTINAIGNAIRDFVVQDIGHLFITNKRIIFVGKERNITKAIKIKDVLVYNLYKDGVLISQANKKGILFKFTQEIDFKSFSIDDGLNEFVIVLNRIISGTEKENLEKKSISKD